MKYFEASNDLVEKFLPDKNKIQYEIMDNEKKNCLD